MNALKRFKFFLWYFGHFQVPLIGYLHPRIIRLSDEEIVICLPLKRRSRNHLKSMYFGALAVGADIAGGLHGFYHADKAKCKISLVFKSFHAQFLKRPESDVYFVCTMGQTVKDMIAESMQTKERVNKALSIKAYTHYLNPAEAEEVADFTLELSVKVL